jgi:hypothetical protein
MSGLKKMTAIAAIALLSLPAGAAFPCDSLAALWGRVLMITVVSKCATHFAMYTCGGPFGNDIVDYSDYYTISPLCQNS